MAAMTAKHACIVGALVDGPRVECTRCPDAGTLGDWWAENGTIYSGSYTWDYTKRHVIATAAPQHTFEEQQQAQADAALIAFAVNELRRRRKLTD